MIRSIRFTLTLWYVGILTVLLSSFGWILYTQVRSSLTKDVDQILASEANGFADLVFTFWQAKWEDEHRILAANGTQEHYREIEKEAQNGHLAQFLTRWAAELTDVDPARAIRVIDRNGNFSFATKFFEKFGIPVSDSTIQIAKQGKTVYQSFNSPQHCRVISYPVIETGQVLYFVQSVVVLEQMDASLAGLKRWIVWLIPLTLIFATAVGWLFATLAFKPIRRLIKQAQSISATHLHERVEVSKTGDELQELGTTFNDMLARLERSFKRLRQFSAAASHELRTPLTIIKGELEVALRAPRDVREYQRVLKTQLEASNEMINIVEQLLALARNEEGEESMDWHHIELSSLVGDVFENWNKIIREKEIKVGFTQNEAVWIRGEKPLLERVVSNLLDNALKHTPPKGHIEVQTTRQEGKAVFMIEDSGPGITKEDETHIFDKFFTKNSSDGNSSGVGLGLCRWIVEAHQGQIEVSSEPGKGACFKVFFPLFGAQS